GLTTTTSGTYIQQTGSLQVTISPPGAVTAGAKWRVDGGTWRDSGNTESGLWIGFHIVEYSTVTGWDKPANESVQINNGQTTTTSGTYIEQVGVSLIISEFMASNASALPLEEGELLDGNNDSSDWIEIYNAMDANVSLDGWYLTDNNNTLTKWQFPDGLQIGPGEFMIIFASQKTYADNPLNYPYLDPAGYYHTNFNLDSGGEFLALVSPDGNTAIHAYRPEYPLQLANISYGVAQYATMLVAKGATASYHVPTSGDAGLGTDWTDPNFVDSGWDIGETGLGFGSAIVETGQDIGTPSAAGSYSVDSNGVYTVLGDGEDIWGATDDFYYVYTPLSGDGEMISRVVSLEQTNNWAKAGVMIREQLTDTSSHAMMIVTPPGGTNAFAFQWVNGASRNNNTQGGTIGSLPKWVRITRVGNDFTGYYAPDVGGSPGTWVQHGTTTISMVEDVYIGLCVTSHSDGVLCTAVFDNVTRGGGITTDLQDKMLGINASLWTRIEFNLEEGQLDLFDTMKLRMKYEDGFVAYLNGQHIAEQNSPASLQWNSTATSDRPIEDSFVFEEINLTDFVDTLQTGKNVLAIHGLNDDKNNDEFLILPELVAASNISTPQYFTTPTPGAFNISGVDDIVSDVWFSHKRGFYDSSFGLMLSTGMDDAEIRYTLDGSQPTITRGFTFNYNTDPPININTTTTIRAVAVKPGWLDSPVETHTYIFVNDVITQSPNGEPPGPGWPTGSVNGQMIDYGMDPDVVVNDPRYVGLVDDALLAIPTISMVTDVNNLFDPAIGIYVNAGNEGRAWERPVSVELIYPPDPQGPGFPDLAWVRDANGAVIWGLPLDMRDGFQIDAGMRIRGGFSVSDSNPKHSFRLFFRAQYGDAKLRYPLFADEGIDEFDNIDLRTSQNYSWAFQNNSANTLVREVWSRDLQGQTGHPYTRSRYYHLYINGHYWGVFQTQERSEASYGETYFGGDKDDYDVISSNWSAGRRMVPTDGNRQALDRLYDETIAGFDNYERYYRVQRQNIDGTPYLGSDPNYEMLLVVDSLIDFMIIEYYTGDRDGPGSRFGDKPNNTWCIYNRVNPNGFIWFHHDNEHTLGAGSAELNMVTPFTSSKSLFSQREYFAPHWLHEQLMFSNVDYRIHFTDHVYRHFFNDGLMTVDEARNRILNRANQIDMAIIAHSARWGDAKRTIPFTKDDHWLPEINDLLYDTSDGRHLTPRVGVVLQQLRDVDWYSYIEPPGFNQHGGWDPAGFNVTMSAPSGTIYYTIDGNDPRLSVAQSASGSVVTLLAENAPKRYLVPGAPVDPPTGTILREYWTGITGTAVSALTSSPDYPLNPSGSDQLTTFEAPTNWADNYGTRVRGYLHPPTTGNYTFWIASDDASELWLSTNADPVNKAMIAHVPGWTNSRVWDKYPAEQQSVAISLTAGQKYYIESLQKEGGGGDNLAVTWEGGGIVKGQPIDGQYLSPAPADDMWASPYLDDSNWPSGTGGVGYERNPGDPVNYVSLINFDVEGDMYGDNSSCYIRIPFTVSHTDLSDMTLKVRYDDGFVAYLNGVEVTRRNFTGAPQWDSAATTENPDTSAVNFENIDISAYIGNLQQGNNLLAIHGLNYGTSDSDFLISVEIVASEISQGDISPSATPYSGTISLDRSTLVKARVLDGTWSAMNEAIFAVGYVADYLRVTEIMYHPKYTGDPNDPNTEFIELKNVGPSTLYLNLVSFTEGIHFTFPDVELVSGGHIVVVKDLTAFDDLYDIQTNNINVAGQYTGSLANNGEGIRLQDAIGRTILDFDYEDGWRSITDGDGF
ncbi:MAG: lamin tail domain-containing protein, partial [Planctomycetota bacterium]